MRKAIRVISVGVGIVVALLLALLVLMAAIVSSIEERPWEIEYERRVDSVSESEVALSEAGGTVVYRVTVEVGAKLEGYKALPGSDVTTEVPLAFTELDPRRWAEFSETVLDEASVEVFDGFPPIPLDEFQGGCVRTYLYTVEVLDRRTADESGMSPPHESGPRATASYVLGEPISEAGYHFGDPVPPEDLLVELVLVSTKAPRE